MKIEPPDGDPTRHSTPGVVRRAERRQGDRRLGRAQRAAARGAARTRTSCSKASGPASGSGSASSCRQRTILCSITGFGADGPRARQAGHDLNYLGYAGALADTAPALPPVQVADLAAGAQAAVIEILAALLERARTGPGSDLVISMTHGSHRFVAHRLAGEPVPRLLTGGAACYRIYETADGRYLTVAALEPKFWQRLCELLDRPDLAGRAFEPELPELDELFRTRTLAEWLALLEHEDTCVGPVLSLEEAARRACLSSPRSPSRSFGIHVGPHRVMPVGYAPAWSPSSEPHRVRDARRPLGRRPATARTARCSCGSPTSRPGARTAADSRSCATAGSGRCAPTGSTSGGSPAALIPTGRPTAAGSRSTATARPTSRAGGTAAPRRTRAQAPIRPTRLTDGSRSSRTARSSSAATSSRPGRRPTGRRTGSSRGSATASSTSPASATTAACSRPGLPRSRCESSCPTSTSGRRAGS